ncbi:DNA polymerase-3 subunit alpha [Leucobacter luti]|uniref:DNA-directed DNA polymerase n=1 Tax=Leucobacter luti TaxID=340320 RepID=A0A4R6RTA9_9MICO|nr:DNA polymerase III subunit alpha [Leucobacter luti]TDP89505.1 DNA polymerase-3 subunit alpha [Leucobacter luti]
MFVHLHVHTEHSMLDGLTRVGDLFDQAQADGAPAVAITDHKSLAAMWEAHKHANRTGVKLLPGLEAYIAIGSRTERQTIEVSADDSASEGGDAKATKNRKTRTYEHLTIIARDRTGWSNLVRLHNESSMHKHGRAQLIDYEVLQKYGEGLMVLTGCIGGPVFGPLSRAVTAEHKLNTLFGDRQTEAFNRASSYFSTPITIPDGSTEKQSEELRALALEAASATGSDGQRYSPQQIVDWTLATTAERGRARENVSKLIDAVGQENVYIEVMEHGNADEQMTLPELRLLAAEFSLPIVATNDSHHTTAEDQTAHSAWLALQTDSTLANSKFSFHGTGYHVRTSQEMRALSDEPWWQEACDNTLAVAARVEWDAMPERRVRLPEFPLPDGFERNTQYLRSLIEQGLEQRFPEGLTQEYKDRLNTELGTISGMGFIDYFLIVHEMITWAREQGFYVGPGRGSAAGSLVAYILGITQLDPIEYDLLFERFLEPGRAELPDIDIDFESRHKQQIIAHLVELWGEDHVAQIGNIGRPQIRQALKDALRVLGEPAALSDKLSKLLPQDLTATELLSSQGTGIVIRGEDHLSVAEFWSATSSVKHLEPVLSLMGSFYNVAKVGGVHASGVIISPEPLTDLIPMRWHKPSSADWSRWVTEWDKDMIEDFGLVKFDILAIRNLDMAHLAIDSVNERTNESLEFYGLPDPDHDSSDPRVRKAFQMLQEGRTAGIFQLESDGMTRLLEEIGPDTLDDLSAVVALFRPGPLSAGMHSKYADRKNGREPVSYDYLTSDPEEAKWLGSVMDVTYGVFCYQEQVMRLGGVVAGFDDMWRSKLRKAVSKKIKSVMDEVGAKFLEGAVQEFRDETGAVYSPVFSEQTANRVWEAMKGSAEYLFNKSHSQAYAYIAYITAYLKANFPAHYGAATLSVTPPDKAEKRLAAMRALIDEGMQVLPPNINESGLLSAPNEAADSVLIGLSEIKGVGSAAEAIIEARTDAPYTSLPDLLKRTSAGSDQITLSHSRVEALIDSGALDAFGPRMGLRFVQRLGMNECAAIPRMEYTALELSVRQTSRLLMSLDANVRQQVQETLTGWTRPGAENTGYASPSAVTVSELLAADVADGSLVHVAGILTSYEERPYKSGAFARVTLEDANGSLTGVLWERERAAAKADGSFPRVGFPVVAFGKIGTRSFNVRSHGSDDEDGDGEEQEIVRQEITVRGVYPIDIPLTQVGGVDFSPHPKIDLTAPQPPEKPSGSKKKADTTAVFVEESARPQSDANPEPVAEFITSAAPSVDGSLALAAATQVLIAGPAASAPVDEAPASTPHLRIAPPIAEPNDSTVTITEKASSPEPAQSVEVAKKRQSKDEIARKLIASMSGGMGR